MNKRHNSLERVGIYIIAQVIEEDFGWIFREQSIVDVGIDAIIEKCSNGIPAGRFIALQIKSGAGNVFKGKEGYTYYISNVHYYYWTNLDLPVLLFCYIPEKKNVYWVEINQSKIKKTKRRWKITLPYDKELNQNSKKEIDKILLKGKGKMLKISNPSDELSEKLSNIKYLNFVNESAKLLAHYYNLYTQNIQKTTTELNSVIDEKNSIKGKGEYLILRSNLIAIFESLASRAYNEIHIFSILFAKAIISIKYHLSILNKNNENDLIEEHKIAIQALSNSFMKSLEGNNSMKLSIEDIANNDVLKIKENVEKAVLALEIVSSELTISRGLVIELINIIEKD